MPASSFLTTVPLLLILGVASLTDWRMHRIPNVLTFGAALFGIVLHATLNGVSGLILGAGGWIVCLICFLPFYARGGMAAGDVKLMAAAGAFLGPFTGIAACLFSLIAGGLIALMSLAITYGSQFFQGAPGSDTIALRDALRTRIPYAGAIALGTSIVVLVPSALPSGLVKFGA